MFAIAALGAPTSDVVASLPSYGTPPTPQWSGYLDAGNGTNLHYYLASAEGPAPFASKPLVLWLNGALTDRSWREVSLATPLVAGGVLLLWRAGRALDATMRNRTRAGIGALLSRMGRSAMVLDESGAHRTVAAEDLERGMLMIVAAGEALAADGVIEEGETTLDNAMLTGESAPQAARVGDTVYAGAINLGNAVRVRVTEAASDTALAGIAHMHSRCQQFSGRVCNASIPPNDG